jgi:hypothetical protein
LYVSEPSFRSFTPSLELIFFDLFRRLFTAQTLGHSLPNLVSLKFCLRLSVLLTRQSQLVFVDSARSRMDVNCGSVRPVLSTCTLSPSAHPPRVSPQLTFEWKVDKLGEFFGTEEAPKEQGRRKVRSAEPSWLSSQLTRAFLAVSAVLGRAVVLEVGGPFCLFSHFRRDC